MEVKEREAQEEEVIGIEKSEEEEQKQEAKDDGKESKAEENPLEKYMKMVLEARERQEHQQVSHKKPLLFKISSMITV